MLRIGRECCPYCRRSNIQVSDPESLWEELAVLLLLRPVRCCDCGHRFYCPLSVPIPIASAGTAESMKATQQADSAEEDEPR